MYPESDGLSFGRVGAFGTVMLLAAVSIAHAGGWGGAEGPDPGGAEAPGPGGAEPPGPGDAEPSTPIENVVMYAIEDDTHELIRYRFGAEAAYVIGDLRYEEGDVGVFGAGGDVADIRWARGKFKMSSNCS